MKDLNNNIENKINKNNKEQKEKEKENNKKILLSRLTDSQKKEIIYNYKISIKFKTLKDNKKKKIKILQSKGCNLDELTYSIDNLFKKGKKKKLKIDNERNIVEEIFPNEKKSKTRIHNTNTNITNNNIFGNHHIINKPRRLITSYSNINVLCPNKRKKTAKNTIKSKINTFEFIKKIKKRFSPSKKLIFNTHINDNYENENNNILEQNNIKNIINDYIKIKRKERKENEIKNKEKINKENLKKYHNFLKLQENIRDSLINDNNKKRNEEEKEKFDEGKIDIFDSTNKSSIFNEREYYIDCYEAKNIYNDSFKNINIYNDKNNLCRSYESNINLNNISNNINKEKNQFCNNFLEKNALKKKGNNILNKIHLLNRKNISIKKFNKNEYKYKEFIKKVIFILTTNIKRKSFILLRYYNSIIIFNNFIERILKIIKSSSFDLLKQNINKKHIIINFVKIINKKYIKQKFDNIKFYACFKKFLFFFQKIKNIYIKKAFFNFILLLKKKNNKIINNNDIDIYKKEEIKTTNTNKLDDKENAKNNDIKFSNKNNNNKNKINIIDNDENIQIIIGDEKDGLILNEKNENENKNENKSNGQFLNNAFFHNKEIFKNLRYEDEDDFFAEDTKMENLAEKVENFKNNDNSKKNEENKIKNCFDKLPKNIRDNIENELTEQIIKEIIDIEINNKDKIIKKKIPINEFNKKHKENASNINLNNTNSNNNSQIDSSSLDNSINNSLLKKSIGEIKEGRKLNKYYQKKFPIFLKMIENNINMNYNEIINNLKKPLIIDEEKYLNKLSDLLYKKNNINNNNTDFDFNNELNENENENENKNIINEQRNSFLNKFNIPYYNKNLINKQFVDEKILKEFNIKNEIMNKKSNEETINGYKYDAILNKCVYDSVNEIIEKRRMYGNIGKPILWSDRNLIIKYKYDESKYSKNNFIKEIIKELKEIINKKIGLIPENYDYMSLENLISDREKKFNKNIHDDLIENEEKDNNIDLIITASLMNISKLIMDQLIEEVIQVLNLIEESRRYPSKFGAKSIYSFENEDIPIFGLGIKNDFEDEDDYIMQ